MRMDIAKAKTIAGRIVALRNQLGLGQKSFSERLCISTGYLTMLEQGLRKPSATLLKLVSYEFQVNADWLRDGEGEIFPSGGETGVLREAERTAQAGTTQTKRKNLARDALVAAAVLGPVAPYLSGTIAIGVGAATLLGKLCQAYNTDNTSDLAQTHLGVDRTTINYWLRTDNIPVKILMKEISKNHLTPEDVAQSADFCLISKAGFSKHIKAACRDARGRELTDDTIKDIFEKARVEKIEE